MTTQARQTQPMRHYQAVMKDGTVLRGGSNGKLPTHVAVGCCPSGALIVVWGTKKRCRKHISKFRTNPLYLGSDRQYEMYAVTQVA